MLKCIFERKLLMGSWYILELNLKNKLKLIFNFEKHLLILFCCQWWNIFFAKFALYLGEKLKIAFISHYLHHN